MIDLNEIQFFVYVAQANSFTMAAKRLGVPKSKVSRALASLETRLGVRLVERTTRRVSLTSDGEVYLRHCQAAMEEAEQADLAVSALRGEVRGKLRVGAPMTFIRGLLVIYLGEFLARHPEIRFHLEYQPHGTNPLEASLDVLIQSAPVDQSTLHSKFLGRGHRSLYASAEYIAKHGAPETPAELRSHACVTRSENGPAVVWRLHKGGDVEEVRVEPRVSVTDPVINWRIALAGLGIAIVPNLLVQDDVQAGRLVRILPDWEPDQVDLYAIYPARLEQSPKVRVFLQWLDELLSSRRAAYVDADQSTVHL